MKVSLECYVFFFNEVYLGLIEGMSRFLDMVVMLVGYVFGFFSVNDI